MRKKFVVFLSLAIMFFSGVTSSFGLNDTPIDGEISRTNEVICEGVTCTHISLGADSKYKKQEIWIVEFDPQDPKLCLQVACGGKYTSKLVTVQDTVEIVKERNKDKGLVPVAAINGDIWTTTYAHARVEGSNTEFGGYSDAVVTHSLTIPRGLDIYDGEIVSSPHTQKETPYERQICAFGITPDGRTVLGTPDLKIKLTDLSRSDVETVSLNGLNRLPANNAIMIYSDKMAADTASLSDAYEIVIDCDYDYVIKHGSVIKGKVTSICKKGDEDPVMKENRLIVTARGNNYVKKVSGIKVGDEIEVSFEITVNKKDAEIWKEVTNSVGGHTILVKNGKAQANSDSDVIPATAIGNTADGKVMFLVVDGRRKDYSVGLKVSDMPDFCKTLGFENCFLLDGGGSSTLLAMNKEGSYEIVNTPCDKYENGEYGKARTVVNSVILSVLNVTPDATEEPGATAETIVTKEPVGDPTETPGHDSPQNGCSSSSSFSVLSLSCFAAFAAMILKKGKGHNR